MADVSVCAKSLFAANEMDMLATLSAIGRLAREARSAATSVATTWSTAGASSSESVAATFV
jgi:hypothetical protein